MSGLDDVWIPLVDEPIGSIVAGIQEHDPEIGRLVNSTHRILAFRTFAYIRVGILLGQLLVDNDVADDAESWVEDLLANPENHARVAAEVRAVAEEIAADPHYADDEPLGPDNEMKARFREFAKKQLDSA